MLPGIYQVELQINSSLPSNPLTQMYIAQNVFTSNIVTIPVAAQVGPSSASSARPADNKPARSDADRPRR
jgi:hypothetical protein